MKKYLNTLFITTQGSYLSKEGETVVVTIEKEKKGQFPLHALGGIVCFGQVSCSPFLMGFCAENNVGMTFLTEYGRFLACVRGESSGNVLLRRQQYRYADDPEFSGKLARYFLTGKLLNSRSVLERALRDHETKIDTDEIEKVSARLRFTLEQMQGDHWTLDQVRGMEGDSAKLYFSVFDHLIVAQKEDFKFADRNRRPPLDNVNCLLSFLYTLVAHDARSALEGVGLDAYVGFLHRDRPGRPGLALDLMEEFRSFLADRLALSLINRQQVTKKDFKKSETGAVLMDDDARKELLTAYQKRKQEEIMHPYLKESLPIGILFHVQAMLLARFLRGDIDAYPAFVWR